MKTQNKLLLFVLILLIVVVFPITAAWAVIASPGIGTFVQPDGTTFEARLVGDEWLNWTETTSGYTILRDEDTGYWVYAQPDPVGGGIKKSSLRVGIDEPVGIKKDLRPKPTSFMPLLKTFVQPDGTEILAG